MRFYFIFIFFFSNLLGGRLELIKMSVYRSLSVHYDQKAKTKKRTDIIVAVFMFADAAFVDATR